MLTKQKAIIVGGGFVGIHLAGELNKK